MSSLQQRIESDTAWDEGKLGRDDDHVEAVDMSGAIDNALNEAVKLRSISIRLEEQLIKDLKMIADQHCLGYQPLIRQLLKRFVTAGK